ncbi:hypothetical protein Pori4_00190 [Pseudomonas phage vB_PpuM-Pori-4]
MNKFLGWFKRLLDKKHKSITMTLTDAEGKLVTIHIPQGAGVEYTLSKSGTHLNVSVKDDVFMLRTNGAGGGGSGSSKPGLNGGPGHTPIPRSPSFTGAGTPNYGHAGDPPVGAQASFPIGARATVSGGGRVGGLSGGSANGTMAGGGDGFVPSPIRSSDRAYLIRGLYYVITTKKITGEQYPIHELLHWGKKSIELMGKFSTVRDAIDELKLKTGIPFEDLTDYQVDSLPKRLCKP